MHTISTHSSATLEDVPPLVFATLGGFLQQLFGARRLLQASAVPAVLTWAVIVAKPNSLSCILASRYLTFLHVAFKYYCVFVYNHNAITISRLFAGLANSLLTGNVYMAECTPSNLVPSFKQIEVKM